MVVDTVTFEGREFPIYLDRGVFWSMVDGEKLHHAMLEGLTKQIRAAVREGASLAIEIAFIETDGDDMRKPIDYTPAKIIGTHAGSGNIIVEYENGRRDQFRSYNGGMYRRVSKKEVDALRAMVKERIRLERAINAWKEQRQVNGKQLVEAERKLQAAVHSNTEPTE